MKPQNNRIEQRLKTAQNAPAQNAPAQNAPAQNAPAQKQDTENDPEFEALVNEITNEPDYDAALAALKA